MHKNTTKTKLVLAGFSFGSAVVSVRSAEVDESVHSILIAPPVERYPYPKEFTTPVSVIQGADDEVVEADGVTDWVREIATEYDYHYSSHTSHFFHGKLVELRYRLRTILSLVINK